MNTTKQPGGSHRTLRAVVAEVQRFYPGEPVYRHGKRVDRPGVARIGDHPIFSSGG